MMIDDTRVTANVPRWIKLCLIVSVAVNLAVVALVAGVFLRQDGPGKMRGQPGLSRYAMPYVLALSKEDRRDMMRDLRGGDARGTGRAARRILYQDALSALRAKPFDLEALTGVIEEQSSASVKTQSLAQKAWLMRIDAMTDAERNRYADRLEEVLSKGPRHKQTEPGSAASDY